MAVLTDNSGSGFGMTLKGGAETRTDAPSWSYAQKIVPVGNNARVAGDAFGTIVDQDGSTMVVGTPNHPYDDQGLNPLTSAGSVWVYTRALAPLSRLALAPAPTKSVFNYTGADQTFVVPAGVTRIRAKMWGAAGGSTNSYRGGCGGYVDAEIMVDPGETLTLIVGQGGAAYKNSSQYGGGGAQSFAIGTAATGGGRSAIRRPWGNDNELLTAAGGGGAGNSSSGGHGGGFTGGTDSAGVTAAPTIIAVGNSGYVGSKFQAATRTPNSAGGAGGGGYFAGSGNDSWGGSGGSSYTGLAVSGFATIANDYDSVPGAADVDYGNNAGASTLAGGTTLVTTTGGNGRIVLIYTSDDQTLQDSYQWQQVARIIPTGMNARNTNDRFGYSVAVSGAWMAVSAPNHDWDVAGTNQTTAAGAVFMFHFENGSWVFKQKVLATGNNARNAADQFGTSVDLQGSTLVVGAPYHDFNVTGSDNQPDAGAVFVFKLDNTGTWVLQQKLIAQGVAGRNSMDTFGSVVKIDGGTIAVSAVNHTLDSTGQNGIAGAGAVFVFTYGETTTTSPSVYHPAVDHPAVTDPDTGEVVTPAYTEPAYTTPGTTTTVGAWTYVTKLTTATRTANDLFGSSLDLKGATIVAGTPGSGRSDIFRLVGSSWINQDSRQDAAVNSSTAALFHFDNGTLLDAAAPAGSQPTVSGTALAYSGVKARYGTSSLYSNQASSTIVTSRAGLTGTGDFTVEFWSNSLEAPYAVNGPLNNVPFTYNSFLAGNSGAWGFTLTRPQGEFNYALQFTLQTGSGTNNTMQMGTARMNEWEHVAIVRRGGVILGYRNGRLVGTMTIGAAAIYAPGSNVIVNSGANWRGYLNELRISREAKYSAEFTPPQHPFRVGDAAGIGRGRAVSLYDADNILVGLPKASGVDGVTKRAVNENSLSTHTDVSARITEGGLVQTLSRYSARWDGSINVSPAGGPSHRNAGDNFGAKVAIVGNDIAVATVNHTRTFFNQEHLQGAGAVFLHRINGDQVDTLRKMVATDRQESGASYGRDLAVIDGTITVSSPNYIKYRATYSESSTYYNYANGNGYCTNIYYTVGTWIRNTNYQWQNGRMVTLGLTANGSWVTSGVTYQRNLSNVTSSNSTPYQNGYSCSPCYQNCGYPGVGYYYDNNWTITPTDLRSNPLIGESISSTVVSPYTVYAGAPQENYNDANYNTLLTSGAILQISTNVNASVGSKLGIPGYTNTRNASDRFGISVSTDGTKIVVGAPFHAFDVYGNNSTANAGAAFSYGLTPDGTWALEQKFFSAGRTSNAYFGRAMSSMTAAGVMITGNNRTDLFGRDTGSWALVDSITSYADAPNNLVVSNVNTNTFAIGIPNRSWTGTGTIQSSNIGDSWLLRRDPKPLSLVGAVAINSTTKKFGTHSVQFQDTTGAIYAPKHTDWRFASTDWAVEFWVNTTATTGELFNNPVSGVGYIRMYMTGGKVYAGTWNGGVTTAVALNDGNWHHLAFTRSGTTQTLYVDGAVSGTYAQAAGSDQFTVRPFMGSGFVGFMDDFRVTMGIARYTAAFTAPTAAIATGVLDPMWANTNLAITFDGAIKDLSNRWWSNEVANDAANLQLPNALSNGRSSNDQFGYSVSLGNNLLAVGVPGYNFYSGGIYQGATAIGGVHVFSYVDQQGEWYAQSQLPSGGTIANNMRMGTTVSFGGNYVVAGCDPNFGSGYYHKLWYQSKPGTWNYQFQNIAFNGSYQSSVALLNDSLAVIGTPIAGTNTQSQCGAFQTLTRVDATWSVNVPPQTTLSNLTYVPATTNGRFETNNIRTNDYGSNPVDITRARIAGDLFGTSVAINTTGDVMVVGSPSHIYNNTNASMGTGAGAAFAYYKDAATGTWRFQGKVVPSGTSGGNVTNLQFGRKLEMRFGYLMVNGIGSNYVIGSAGNTQFFRSNGGTVTGSFSYQSEITGTAGSEFSGSGVTLVSDSLAVMGSYNMSFGSIPAMGAFRTALRAGTTWTVGTYNRITGNAYGRLAGDRFGYNLALNNGTLLVGTPYSARAADGTQMNSNSGSVFVFNFDNTQGAFVYSQRVLGDNVVNSYFGGAIDYHATTAVVSGIGTSRFNVLTRAGNTWTAATAVVGSAGQGNSATVIADDRIVVGLPNNTLPDGVFNMAAYTDIGGWRQYININGTWALDAIKPVSAFDVNGYEITGRTAARGTNWYFGRAVSLGPSNLTLAVGAPGQNTVNEYGGTIGSENTGVVYMWNQDPATGKFVFANSIANPGFAPVTSDSLFGTSLDLESGRLLVGAPGANDRGTTFTFLQQDNVTWNLEKRYVQGHRVDAAQSVAFVKDNSVIANGMPSHSSYPAVSLSGRVFTQKFVNGNWSAVDERQGGDGQNANWATGNDSRNINAGGGGGGGSGAIGGSGGAVSNINSGNPAFGGLGGTHLVPAGGTGYAGYLNKQPLDSDPDNNGAGAGALFNTATAVGSYGNKGANARIVLSWSGGKQVFDYTGSDQRFVVPNGVTSVDIKMWGAGGGSTPRSMSNGGAGGAVTGTLQVNPGDNLVIVVGSGGLPGYYNGLGPFRADFTPRYGGASMGGLSDGTWQPAVNGGGGGGRAEILLNGVSLAIAGGGGGAGAHYGSQLSGNLLGYGQPGGANNSGAGRNRLTANASSELQVGGPANGRFSGDQFGYAVEQDAYSNIIVGVPFYDYDANGDTANTNRGAVFTYVRNPVTKLSTYSGRMVGVNAVNGNFGVALEAKGDRLLVTSSGLYASGGSAVNTAGGTSGYGALDFFQYQPASQTWALESHIEANSVQNSGIQAYALGTLASDSLSVVGTPRYDGSNATQSPGVGTVSQSGGFDTITRGGSTWTLQGRTVLNGLSFGRFANDQFGYSVKLGQNWLAISSRAHDYNESGTVNVTDMGAVFTFKLDGNSGTWVYETKLVAPTPIASSFAGNNLNLVGGNTLVSPYGVNTVNNGFVFWQRDTNTGAWSSLTTNVVNLNYGATNVPYVAIDATKLVLGWTTANTSTTGQPTVSGAGAFASCLYNGTTWNNGVNITTVPGSSNGRVAGDNFGYSVYAGGSYVAVGSTSNSFNEVGNSVPTAGAVYVFAQPGGKYGTEWRFERKLKASFSSSFNYATKISGSGSSILVGSNATNQELWQRVTPGNWSMTNALTTVGSGNSLYNISLATPDMIVVGNFGADGTTAGRSSVAGCGVVSTTTRSNNVWAARADIAQPGASNARMSSDNFGFSVSLSRNYLMVGAPSHNYDVNGATPLANAGAVFVYSRVGNNYSFVTKSVAPADTRKASTYYGSAVSVDEMNTYVAVGAPTASQTSTGYAYAYGFDGSKFNLMNTFSGTGLFGRAVAINSGRMAVGAPNNLGTDYGLTSLSNAGVTVVYRLNSSLTSWTQQEVNTPATRAANALQGYSVSLSRTSTMLLGAYGDKTTGTISLKYVP